ncbi:hypothetical protein E2C01_023169 [Portunus trituberculatus]|uniref:Uncharacterized protein n=1 Tax=Portunus trituberculatus TaxID=210409 RepID=A0A5B7E9A4_PORTR|nr:hypothetical protein [Portunus trituberculatus]
MTRTSPPDSHRGCGDHREQACRYLPLPPQHLLTSRQEFRLVLAGKFLVRRCIASTKSSRHAFPASCLLSSSFLVPTTPAFLCSPRPHRRPVTADPPSLSHLPLSRAVPPDRMISYCSADVGVRELSGAGGMGEGGLLHLPHLCLPLAGRGLGGRCECFVGVWRRLAWVRGEGGRGAGAREGRQALGGGSMVAPVANLVQTLAAATTTTTAATTPPPPPPSPPLIVHHYGHVHANGMLAPGGLDCSATTPGGVGAALRCGWRVVVGDA